MRRTLLILSIILISATSVYSQNSFLVNTPTGNIDPRTSITFCYEPSLLKLNLAYYNRLNIGIGSYLGPNIFNGNGRADWNFKYDYNAKFQILREKLAFKGIIMTDDLSMGAITKYKGGKNACVDAFNAGNDILLTGGSLPENFNAVYNAVKSGKISEKRLDESVQRILVWKYEMGIIK